MRAGVFSRYWSTGGGGEKYAGTIAEVLAERFDTELLGVEPVDTAWLAERLNLDLSGTMFRVVDDAPEAVTTESREHDVFVNMSYLSADPVTTPGGIYVVMFPVALDGHLSRLQQFVVRRLGGLTRSLQPRQMTWGTGFHPRGAGRRQPIWTDGSGTLRFMLPPGAELPVAVAFGYQRPGPPTEISIEIDGEQAVSTVLEAPSSRWARLRPHAARFTIRGRESGAPIEVRIVSSSFVPAEVLGSDDTRQLGVPLVRLRVANAGLPLRLLGRLFPVLLTPQPTLDWLDTYGKVLAISEYTQEWVARRWKRHTEVLYPPVTMHSAADKQPIILNVGRFFAADRGHSKKQLEQVRAFRALCDAGIEGWSLHLVGGCAEGDRPYLRQVEREASGYPVHIHVDSSGAELQELYASASIYWHASGLGEDVARNPDRMEHFGITTVEAMSAGAVPVVIGLAGQLETVRDGVDGFHFTRIEELVEKTRELIANEQLRARMSKLSEARARTFSRDAFAARLNRIVDDLLAAPERGDQLEHEAP